ncbi:flagellum-specific peptidoglycan hydrolase FlgJ [Lactobacillus colini]|uniref:Flagellum-specific peptidoglycan hydrolase FlgJ n=1 Tax=Lactobacillus colini TaxID=1819254 RepID=A0ABS4MFI4_9LACO|nr:glycoside hydrolase family 73 protein [Lactobacillus colini]MBP2058434.1 flagellum-specific peptidoglycan hydrolase FlgJ [Lactobacillus colini]
MTRRFRRRKKKLRLKSLGIIIAIILLIIGLGYYIKKMAYDNYLRQAQTEKEFAQQSRDNFIKVIAPIAQREDKAYGILPSITIAQACLESNYGQSQLAKKYNNLFGVKGTDPNKTKVLTTKEYVNGQWQVISGRFQVYDTYEASIKAHTKLFINGTTWNPNQYRHVLNAKDYRSQAKALETDGYATDPGYAEKLIYVIEKYNLNQYD